MRLAALCLALAGAVSALQADDNVSECCPTCEAWDTDCPFSGWVLASFPTQQECVAACFGGCLYNPSAQWDCLGEPCGPNPCGFTTSDLVGGTSPRLGQCVPGTNYTGAPDRTMDIPGAYALIVNQSQTMMLDGGWSMIVDGFVDGAGDQDVMTMYTSSLWWIQTNPDDDSQYYLFSKNSSTGVIKYGIPLPGDYDYIVFAASDEVIVSGVWDDMEGGGRYNTYVAGEVNSSISSVVIRQQAFNIEYAPIVRGSTVFIIISLEGVEPAQYNLFYWDAYQPKTVSEVNITLGPCMYPGQNANAINPGDIEIFCDDDHDVSTCTLYFAARDGEEGDGYLCKMPITSGKIGPIIPKSTYIPGDTVGFFRSGVVVSAPQGSTRVSPDDLMVYLYKDGSYHWVNDELEHTVSYCYANAYVNIHQPGGSSSAGDWLLIDDVLVYKVTPGFGSAAYWSYNLTAQTLEPVALPFGVPNTKCNYYTYGGNCDQCEDETVGGFTSVYSFSNNSLAFEQSVNVDGSLKYGVAQFDSPVTVPSMRCAACAPLGGTCVAGKCYCVPGCHGDDCSQGAAFCNQPVLDCPTPSR